MSEELKAAARIVLNESGKVLFCDRYTLSRLHGVNDWWIEGGQTYFVLAASFTEGKNGCGLVEYIVRNITEEARK